MDVTSASQVAQVYATRVAKLAETAAKAEGEGSVALIEGATQPGPNGEGRHINTYA